MIRFSRLALGMAALSLVCAPLQARDTRTGSARETSQAIAAALADIAPAMQIAGRPVERSSLQQLMERHRVPAVSIAVVRDGKIVWKQAYGWARDGLVATPNTLFQAASISKPVTAMAALDLSEAGKLDLDAPVNEQLVSWTIPDSDVAAGSEVTLRQLLSHSAGLTVRGFEGYEANAAMPTLKQVLDGVAPANSKPVRIGWKPGSRTEYSGGGYTVVQQLLADASGKDFPALMESLVIKPLGMSKSTFRYPLPGDWGRVNAAGHDRNGKPIPNGFRVQPELAAAGLWTTPTDLARWAIDLMAAYRGDRGSVLTPATARAMLTPQSQGWGLGLQVNDQGPDLRFSHSGVNAGFHSLMVGYPTRGDAFVIMTNGDNGSSLFRSVRLAVGKAMGWPDSDPQVITPIALGEEYREGILGTYVSGSTTITVSERDGRLFATQSNSGIAEIIPVRPNVFLAPDIGARIEVQMESASGQATALTAGGVTFARKSEKD